jgi:prepilin-type N-terminal cleavage/methylation domain-containing protein
MTRKLDSKGFSVVEVVVVLVIIAVLALGGFFVWQRNKDDDAKTKNNTSQNNTDNKDNEEEPKDEEPADPSEGGKYLVIVEWGVRFELPTDLRGDVSYSLGEVVIDPDNNQIQSAKLLLKNVPAAGNECSIVATAEGEFIDTAAQLLRVEKDKPFDTSRYKGIFKADLLSDSEHKYHLNYITPDCASTAAVEQIEELQSASEHLKEIE